MHDVVIIGAGPAGVATSVQLRRLGIDTVLFEEKSVGGLVRNANLIENYAGFPEGITGVEFVRLLDDHLYKLDIEVRHETVNSVSYDGSVFQTVTSGGTTSSRTLVLATGTVPNISDIPGVSQLVGRSVFYEAYPLLTMKGRKIVIVGAGDAAFDYGLNLGQNNSVFIYGRGQSASCLPLLIKQARQNKNVIYRKNHVLRRVVPGGNMLDLHWETSGRQWNEKVDFLLFAIGRTANVACLDDSVKESIDELQESGLFYMIGDVKNGKYRQASISAGEGVRAAMAIADKLNDI